LRQTAAFAAATSAVPFLPACAAPPRRIAIIGGGMAGLHCGHRLRKANVDFTLYEAQKRVGGRMLSDRATFAPQVCELGAELIDTGHLTMKDLAAEFGLTLLDFQSDPLSSTVANFFGGLRVSEADVLAAYEPIADAIDRDLATLTGDGTVGYANTNNGESLDGQSIAGWFDGLVAAGTIDADNVARKLLDVAYTIEFGQPTSQQSALNMLVLISTALDDFTEFGESDERFIIAGGNDQLTTALAATIEESIVLEHALTSLSRDEAGAFVMTFQNGEQSRVVEADVVVMTLPFSMLRTIKLDPSLQLSDVKLRAINELQYGNNAKLMVGFPSRVWRDGGDAFGGSSYSDTGYQATWETSRLQDGDAGILTNFTGAQRALDAGIGTPADEAARFLVQFESVVPGATQSHDGRVARFHWPTNAYVRGSYACYAPGQYVAFSGVEMESAVDGNLLFAGEHTSLDAQGYMEGAAITGAAAAAAILGADTSQALLSDDASPADRIGTRAQTVLRRGRWS
jgi:monoamine oxidase